MVSGGWELLTCAEAWMMNWGIFGIGICAGPCASGLELFIGGRGTEKKELLARDSSSHASLNPNFYLVMGQSAGRNFSERRNCNLDRSYFRARLSEAFGFPLRRTTKD